MEPELCVPVAAVCTAKTRVSLVGDHLQVPMGAVARVLATLLPDFACNRC